MVRVNHKELIRLLRGALHAAELESTIADLTADRVHAEAEVRARDLLHERDPRRELASISLLADLPITQDGRLHDPAFLALVDQEQQWAQREHLVVQWAEQTSKEQ